MERSPLKRFVKKGSNRGYFYFLPFSDYTRNPGKISELFIRNAAKRGNDTIFGGTPDGFEAQTWENTKTCKPNQ